MTEERLLLAALLEKAGDGDFLRAVAEAMLQLLMESDVEGLIGAGRSGERTTYRNGYRDRTLDTGSARCSCASRSCGRAATSRRFSKSARARRRR
jgi:transposase-like protein